MKLASPFILLPLCFRIVASCGQIDDVQHYQSQVEGILELHEYSVAENKKLASSKHHEDSCRSVEFNTDGSLLFTASADASIGQCPSSFVPTCHSSSNGRNPHHCLSHPLPDILSSFPSLPQPSLTLAP